MTTANLTKVQKEVLAVVETFTNDYSDTATNIAYWHLNIHNPTADKYNRRVNAVLDLADLGLIARCVFGDEYHAKNSYCSACPPITEVN